MLAEAISPQFKFRRHDVTTPWYVDMTDAEWDALTPEQQVATTECSLWRNS